MLDGVVGNVGLMRLPKITSVLRPNALFLRLANLPFPEKSDRLRTIANQLSTLMEKRRENGEKYWSEKERQFYLKVGKYFVGVFELFYFLY